MQKYKTRQISINEKQFEAIIADTMLKRIIGLMYREKIEKNQCMLFTFWGSGKQAIWMKNMKFAIDVIWIDDTLKIVDIQENLQPCSSILNCPEYNPKADAKYIIELNSGAVKENSISGTSAVKI